LKTTWIINKGRPNLLLFFNGWGMDDGVGHYLQRATPEMFTHDVLLFHDYRDLAIQGSLEAVFDRYLSIDLAAWSLGVRVALHVSLPRVDRALALNGTPEAISESSGIPEEIFRGTLEHYSEENRLKFDRRMYGSGRGHEGYAEVLSARSTADQEAELRAIWHLCRESGSPPLNTWHYGKAVIGRRDLVFPVKNQLNAWQATPTMIIDTMPHFPFFHLCNWAEVVACFQ
jgi:biotin synthesis protein BioG